MPTIPSSFQQHLCRVTPHGVGLSVDVYSPDLFALAARLDACGLSAGYLEVFKATVPAIGEVRRRLSDARLAYHGEGIWITDPDLTRRASVLDEITAASQQ